LGTSDIEQFDGACDSSDEEEYEDDDDMKEVEGEEEEKKDEEQQQPMEETNSEESLNSDDDWPKDDEETSSKTETDNLLVCQWEEVQDLWTCHSDSCCYILTTLLSLSLLDEQEGEQLEVEITKLFDDRQW